MLNEPVDLPPSTIQKSLDGSAARTLPGGPSGTLAALPIAWINKAATDQEKDALMRYWEASELAEGRDQVSMMRMQPRGRFARYKEKLGFEDYKRYEVAAFRYIWASLSREWQTIAGMFVRQMNEDAKMDFVQFGAFMIDEMDIAMATGSAMATYRTLAIRLKEAYIQFFRWVETQEAAHARGKPVSGDKAKAMVDRSELVGARIRQLGAQRADVSA